MIVKMLLFLGLTSCRFVGSYRSFGGTSCIYLRWKKMQTADSYVKMLHVYQSTRRHILKQTADSYVKMLHVYQSTRRHILKQTAASYVNMLHVYQSTRRHILKQTADSFVKMLHVYQSTRRHILKHVISKFFLYYLTLMFVKLPTLLSPFDSKLFL